MLSLIFRYSFLVLLMSCSLSLNQFKPENFFEGNFLPIGKAIFNNNSKEVIDLLSNKGIAINAVGKGGKSGKPTFLMYAVLLEKHEIVETLLKLGADPNQKCILSNQNKTNDSKTGVQILYHEENPLNYASYSIHNLQTAKKICGLLIDNGAEINNWGDYYSAPLKNAVVGHEGENAQRNA